MARVLADRLVQGLVTVFLVTILVFVLGRTLGDPVALLLTEEAAEEDIAALKEHLGLDRPLPVQYYIFLRNAVRGDLGTSIWLQQDTLTLYWAHFPATLRLVAASMALALALGMPLGLLSARYKGRLLDKVSNLIATVGIATPNFWLGLALIIVFSVLLGLLPVAGDDGPLHYILPTITLGTYLVAGFARLLRSSALEVMESDFVTLARVKGVSEQSILWKHCLRNAAIPLLSFGGVYFAILLGGSVVTEAVFAWPGVGRLAYDALLRRDFPVLQTVVLLHAVWVVGAAFVVDFLYAVVDPRIRIRGI